MLVDAVAAYPHYREHLLPIFNALPIEVKGTFHPTGVQRTDPNRACLVAGDRDARVMGQRQPIFYVEHGSGQTYAGDQRESVRLHPSYSGGGGRRWENVLGFICPSETVAARWTSAPAVAVGCPKLDQYRGVPFSHLDSICFAFHWEGTLCAESGTAYWHYAKELPDVVQHLRSLGFIVYGHAHPRWKHGLDTPLQDAGMTLLPSEIDVFRHVGMLIADNTSLTAEMASLGRKVALLNCPQYRRDVDHGGRFWDWQEKLLHFDEPWDIIQSPLGDEFDHPNFGLASDWLAKRTYAFNDAHAAERAASFIVECLLEM